MDLVSILVVARFLTPADFGLVAIGIATLSIIRSFTDLQVSAALVYSPTLERADLDTAFTLSCLRGLVIGIGLLAAAWPFAIIFKDERLVAIMAVLAIAPLATALSSPMLASFERQVRYGPSAVTQLAGKFAAVAVSIALAWAMRSYWALIGGLVAAPIISTLISYLYAPYRPRFSLARCRSQLNFAGWVTLGQIATALYAEGDRFFVGGVLGKVPLGYYMVGINIAATTTWSFASMTIATLFSGFTQVRDDRPRLIAAYAKGQRVMMALMAPVGCGMAALSEPLVALLVGAKWAPVAPIIAVIAPVVAFQMMVVATQSLAMALGETKAIFLRNALCLAIAVPMIIGGALTFGLMGAVVARAVTSLLSIYLNFLIVKRLLAISVWQQLVNVWRSLASALVMTLVLLGALRLGPAWTTDIAGIALLIGHILLGGLVYYATHLSLWCLAGRPDGAETFAIGIARRLLAR